jgi:hypothetical protein
MKPMLNKFGYVTCDTGGDIAAPEGVEGAEIFRYKRVDDAWVDAFPNDDGASFWDSYNALVDSWAVAEQKVNLIPVIKAEAARQIEATAWKVERATEIDATNNSNTLADVYAERAAIRAASNAHEEALDDITTLAGLGSFNPANF